MVIKRVFKSGGSQIGRLPVGFQLTTDEVEIFKHNNEKVIRKKNRNLSRAFEILTHLPEDFFADGREDSLSQEQKF